MITLQMRFAIDANRDRRIQPDEVVGLNALAARDRDHDGVVKASDMHDVYFEYGHDVWLPADRPSRVEKDGWTATIRMDHVDIKTGAVDVQVRIN